ncbi:hypothetical protein [Phthorimaea operculella granulovirus]|uniref:Uncharacterized protein n=1 Tax=Phthorimaea operculella granulovirus TaxID=192584 RepID=Q8JS02_9BBAC|nr:hypothetical protein [Phthorimaea operculella granulovirus]AAM70255.1 unknown [Phthorimaea operculella granulovirus]ANY57446.1 hypothetical protein PhopGVgp057 [Phthorimaea operculella granulovirus]QBH65892.1 hypothetical protein PhopGVgp057 [Phthorimaea operculella granulovirus]QBH66022.1 hypothetical protein PhopGVgp057 [Phthorimaea operculella granulovirus]QBH66152.1 hypothetical protein PhopGVgp057 [Phthorimaea operculella granulovirus]
MPKNIPIKKNFDRIKKRVYLPHGWFYNKKYKFFAVMPMIESSRRLPFIQYWQKMNPIQYEENLRLHKLEVGIRMMAACLSSLLNMGRNEGIQILDCVYNYNCMSKYTEKRLKNYVDVDVRTYVSENLFKIKYVFVDTK